MSSRTAPHSSTAKTTPLAVRSARAPNSCAAATSPAVCFLSSSRVASASFSSSRCTDQVAKAGMKARLEGTLSSATPEKTIPSHSRAAAWVATTDLRHTSTAFSIFWKLSWSRYSGWSASSLPWIAATFRSAATDELVVGGAQDLIGGGVPDEEDVDRPCSHLQLPAHLGEQHGAGELPVGHVSRLRRSEPMPHRAAPPSSRESSSAETNSARTRVDGRRLPRSSHRSHLHGPAARPPLQ